MLVSAELVSSHRVPLITPSPALSRRMYWLGPVPLPVRSPSTWPSTPTLEPAKLLKSSGRLLQVRVASLLAMICALGRVTWYTTLTWAPTSSWSKFTLKPPLVLTLTPAGRLPGP
ncbi:hypothetical protein D3C80_1794690 [compost metagenome]